MYNRVKLRFFFLFVYMYMCTTYVCLRPVKALGKGQDHEQVKSFLARNSKSGARMELIAAEPSSLGIPLSKAMTLAGRED